MGISLTSIISSVVWRWEHITLAALLAAPFYLFPAITRRVTVSGVLLCVVILFGYGNMKYLLLALPFLVHARTESVPA